MNSNDKDKLPPQIIQRVCKRTVSRVLIGKQLLSSWRLKSLSSPLLPHPGIPLAFLSTSLRAPVHHSCHCDLKIFWLFLRMQLSFLLTLVSSVLPYTWVCQNTFYSKKVEPMWPKVIKPEDALPHSFPLTLVQKCSWQRYCGLVSHQTPNTGRISPSRMVLETAHRVRTLHWKLLCDICQWGQIQSVC